MDNSIKQLVSEAKPDVKTVIEREMQYYEKEHNIKILFAIENGSRAWNMASKNSDYDVRFVFKRNVEDYISLIKQKDVIETFYDDNYQLCSGDKALLDIVGFDIIKFMGLLSKSNPTSIEWLMSDIIYWGSNDLAIKQYVKEKFNPKTLIYHYISLCKKHYNRYISENKKVTHKMYLYMMRGLLNALYVYVNDKIPPLDFTKTVEVLKTEISTEVYETMKEIIRIKSSGLEKDTIKRIDVLDDFIQKYMNKEFEVTERHLDIQKLNDFMQNEILNK